MMQPNQIKLGQVIEIQDYAWYKNGNVNTYPYGVVCMIDT